MGGQQRTLKSSLSGYLAISGLQIILHYGLFIYILLTVACDILHLKERACLRGILLCWPVCSLSSAETLD